MSLSFKERFVRVCKACELIPLLTRYGYECNLLLSKAHGYLNIDYELYSEDKLRNLLINNGYYRTFNFDVSWIQEYEDKENVCVIQVY